MKTREDQLTDKDIEEHLLPYHLESGKNSKQQKAIIQPKALYVFTKKEQKNALNMRSLQKTSNNDNPVARINHITYAKNNNALPTTKHFKKGHINSRPFLCEGAKVKIQGKNFRPMWGLVNGAIGKIINIVFDKNKNPNHGDHPNFVVVNFPQYIGPT